jgi:hypothetical protein
LLRGGEAGVDLQACAEEFGVAVSI